MHAGREKLIHHPNWVSETTDSRTETPLVCHGQNSFSSHINPTRSLS